MAQVITVRRLVTELVLRSKPAERALAAYDKLWKGVAKGAQDAAKAVNEAADGMASTVDRMANAARSAGSRAASAGRGGGGGSGGGRGRAAKDPLDDAIRRANAIEAAAARRAGISEASTAGMRAGAVAITSNTEALKKNATAADRSVAKIKDLTAQADRNKREMIGLRAQTTAAGDASGTLAARSRGLAVRTAEVNLELAKERRNLREVSGTANAAAKVLGHLGKITGGVGSTLRSALGVAGGNIISATASRITQGIGGALVGAAKEAMAFETSLVDIQKVARGTDETAEGMARIKDGIKAASKELGFMPNEVAELSAQITPVFSGKEDIVELTKDVTKIGVAWDVSGKEAGKFFADTSRGLELTAAETKDLFGSINELSNQMGVKAADIAEAMTRSAGVIKMSGLSAETGAALNTTLIAAGASAEVAATGVRTFLARLEAGRAATPKQQKAFEALGFSAEDVGAKMSKGGKEAESQILAIVKAMASLDKKDQLPTLIELFGSESIGSIGAAATATEGLGKAFAIAGGEAGNFSSVLAEYDRASNTTARRVEKLKANIGVLAIEFGERLLPYVDRVVAFLTSPEGQEWGAKAVEKAAKVVTGLADGIGVVANVLGTLIDLFGGPAGLGVAILALRGPFGLALAAGIAMGAGIAAAISSVVNRAENARQALMRLRHDAAEIEHKEAQAAADASQKERNEIVDANMAQLDRERRAKAATDRWERAEKAKLGGGLTSEASLAITRKAAQMRHSLLTGAGGGSGSADDRIATFEASLGGGPSGRGGGGGGGGEARFQELLAARESRQLKPTEAAELRKLSKSLDMAIPTKPGSGRGGGSKVDLSGYSAIEREELWKELSARKASGAKLKPSEARLLAALAKDLDRASMSKEDLALANMSPELAGVLRTGGDGGLSGDALSRGVFAKATQGQPGLGGVGGVGGVGPGPNITNNIYNTTVTVQQAIDARSSAPVPQNIREAAHEAGTRVGQAAVQFTGAGRVAALRNSGGRLAGT